MTMDLDALLAQAQTYTAFGDHRRHLATDADLGAVLAAAQAAIASGEADAVTIFHDATGERTEAAGDADAVRGRLHRGPAPEPTATRAGPGRPKLGVVSREVSLLPRHWDWLNAQRGGASAAIRRMVEEVRKREDLPEAARKARDAADKAMTVLAGDQPGFEEALRALYARDFDRATAASGGWPDGVGAHVGRLLATARALDGLAADA